MWEPSGSGTTPEHAAESNEPAVDSRNDETEGAESAPLLSSETDANSGGDSAQASASPKSIYVLTALALSFAIAVIVFLIATQIVLTLIHRDYDLPWHVNECMVPILTTSIFSLLFSTYNTFRLRSKRFVPLLANIIIDVIIAAIATTQGFLGWFGAISREGDCYYSSLPENKCHVYGLIVRIFAGLALGFGMLLGLTHLALLVLRCRMVVRTQFWKRPLSFPNGQLTVEFSIKLFKEPQKPREGGADAV